MPRLSRLVPMLRARDLKRTVRFWRDGLGCKVEATAPAPPHRPTWCQLGRDGVQVMFFCDDPQEEEPPGITGQVYLYVDDVLALYDELKRRVHVLWGPEVLQYGFLEFAVQDPDGYTVSFAQPPARGAPGTWFSSAGSEGQ